MKSNLFYGIIILFLFQNLLAKEIIENKNIVIEQNTKETTSEVKKFVKINGMVCAFCVDNLKKVFSKTDAVSSLDIDLKTKLLTLKFKIDKTLEDDEIKKYVKDAGYNVVSISAHQ